MTSTLGLICILALIGGIAGWLWHESLLRTAAIQSLATRFGFVYIGSALPKSFSLADTSLRRASAWWNVIDGDWHGGRVLVFDCKLGTGKGSRRITVFALQGIGEESIARTFSPQLEVERSGKWILMFEQQRSFVSVTGLWSVNQIEANLNAIPSGHEKECSI